MIPSLFWSFLRFQPHAATLTNKDRQLQLNVFACVHASVVERFGSNPTLLIPANEHNLEARLSSYVCWQAAEGRSPEMVKEEGKAGLQFHVKQFS